MTETVLDKSPVKCPACGYKSALTYEDERSLTMPYGPVVEYRQRFLRCESCTEEIHLNVPFNNEEVTNARLESDRQAMVNMLDHLLGTGAPAVGLERQFRIPFGTLEMWRAGNFTRAEITLVRLIRTYPWLLSVIDRNFEDSYCDGCLILAADTRVAEVFAEKYAAIDVETAKEVLEDDSQ